MPSPFRDHFPLLKSQAAPYSYLDNASTTQKPASVIEAVANHYRTSHGNTHRATHRLASQAERAVEQVREQVMHLLQATTREEIIFTAGATASLNLVAHAYGPTVMEAGDEVITSAMEHHSNFLPWKQLCDARQAHLKVIPLTPHGTLDETAFTEALNTKTKIVALTHLSHVLGTLNPLQRLTAAAHRYGATVVIDAAQSVAHLPIDVRTLDCDFLACSGHKMYGPTGVGVLYGKKACLERMIPHQVGGGMVQAMDEHHITYEELPHRLEAGTLPIASIVGLGAAITFIEAIGYERLHAHEAHLMSYAQETLHKLPALQMIGAPGRVGICSFLIHGQHPLDVGIQLDLQGIATRTGTHCAMPLMQALNIEGTIRIAFACYNSVQEIDHLAGALKKITARPIAP